MDAVVGGAFPETGVIPRKSAVVIGAHGFSAEEFPERNPVATWHHTVHYWIYGAVKPVESDK